MKKLATAACAILLASAWLYSTEQWRYFYRVYSYPTQPITDFEWYDSLAIVDGRSDAARTATASVVVRREALKAAVDYVRKTPRSSVVVLHRGQLLLESYPQKQNAERLTNSMSMAKSIIALLIGIAIEEGAINSVEDSVALYLPAWGQDDRKQITLRHLLTMASGLRCDKDTEDITSDIILLHVGTDIERLTIEMPAVENPGQKYEYNNFNTQVLAVILERATGRKLNDYLSEKLWKPVGAKAAYLWKDRSDGMARAYCCFFARARDFARIGQLILNKGRVGQRQVVSKDWINLMAQASRNEPEYGLHIWRASREGNRRKAHRSEEFLDQSMVYLDGKNTQRVYVLPKYDLVIVRAGERPRAWDDAFLPNLFAREVARTSSASASR